MARCWLARPGKPVDGLETHHPHEATNTLPVHLLPLALQPGSHLAHSVERCGQILAVNQLHQDQILLRDSFRLVVETRPADAQQPTLAYH